MSVAIRKCEHAFIFFLIRYIQHLRGAKRSGLQKEIVTGLSMGVYFAILFGIRGLAYW